MTAVEFLENELLDLFNTHFPFELFEKAQSMEKVKEAKRLLFIGKVSQIIGFDKTAELLKEVEKEIKKGI